MTSQRQVYLNGQFVPESEARISIFDSALMVGDMIFEFTRTFNGQPFHLPAHLERLYTGLKILEIECGLSLAEMEAATRQTVEINRPHFPAGVDFQIVHNVSRGPVGYYPLLFPAEARPTVAINTWLMTFQLGALAGAYDRGVHAVTPRQPALPARLVDPKIKSRSRIYYQIADLQAKKIDPQGWALLLDEAGFITEGTRANFFIVKAGQLLTAEPRNILRGVTRQQVLALAREVGLPCRETNIEPYDVITADEAFFTGTSFSILPATRFNGQPIGNGRPGPITERLIGAWNELVGVDIKAQARMFAALAQRSTG
jgi:branched-chain amino acid aminotransferase